MVPEADPLTSEQHTRGTDADMPGRVTRLAERLRAEYDTRPVTQAEWDAACGDPE